MISERERGAKYYIIREVKKKEINKWKKKKPVFSSILTIILLVMSKSKYSV